MQLQGVQSVGALVKIKCTCKGCLGGTKILTDMNEKERRMRDLNPQDFHLRVFETRALGRYANPPGLGYGKVVFSVLFYLALRAR